MKRTQISLDPHMYEEAREEARKRGISFAELVRRALLLVLPAGSCEHPWTRFAGVVEDGGGDASATVDDVVYGRDRP